MNQYPYEAKEDRSGTIDNLWWYNFTKENRKWHFLCDIPECRMCKQYKEEW